MLPKLYVTALAARRVRAHIRDTFTDTHGARARTPWEEEQEQEQEQEEEDEGLFKADAVNEE